MTLAVVAVVATAVAGQADRDLHNPAVLETGVRGVCVCECVWVPFQLHVYYHYFGRDSIPFGSNRGHTQEGFNSQNVFFSLLYSYHLPCLPSFYCDKVSSHPIPSSNRLVRSNFVSSKNLLSPLLQAGMDQQREQDNLVTFFIRFFRWQYLTSRLTSAFPYTVCFHFTFIQVIQSSSKHFRVRPFSARAMHCFSYDVAGKVPVNKENGALYPSKNIPFNVGVVSRIGR